MAPHTDDLRILSLSPLTTPAELLEELPCDEPTSRTVAAARQRLHAILHGADERLAVMVGPCSIHDPEAALDYAGRLRALRDSLGDSLELVMRVYFEKPRTIVGWKGLINDPGLDGSFRINDGLRIARGLLRKINALGLPAGCEYLDVTTPQYLSDLVGWGAIGARTTESQVHREMASGLSCPVGFKNGTDGNVRIAVDAVRAASQPHHFLAVTKDGRPAIAQTKGNPDGHVILRGGTRPNYSAESVDAACALLAEAGLPARLVVDVSHANSRKRPENQPRVAADLAARVAAGDRSIAGIMIESHLHAGRQDLVPGRTPDYGRSITDGCIGWETTVAVLERLADAVRRRRARTASGWHGACSDSASGTTGTRTCVSEPGSGSRSGSRPSRSPVRVSVCRSS